MNRPGRALVGYMVKDQALHVLNAGSAPAPAQIPELEARWTSFRKRVGSRPEFKSSNPIVDAVPVELEKRLDEISVRSDLVASFAPHRWQLGLVDLTTPILTYQSVVQTESARERVAKAIESDWDSLVEVCLPPATETQVEGGFDPSQNAFTLSSLNPNLRILSFDAVDVPVEGSPSPKKVFGFSVGLGSPYMQFIEYQGRWMVRDGHHRLYGLLQAGIRRVPAVVIRGRTFEETGAGRPGFFGFELLYGQHPPQLRDFLDDDFAADVEVRAVQKVVRIKADEFPVLV